MGTRVSSHCKAVHHHHHKIGAYPHPWGWIVKVTDVNGPITNLSINKTRDTWKLDLPLKKNVAHSIAWVGERQNFLFYFTIRLDTQRSLEFFCNGFIDFLQEILPLQAFVFLEIYQTFALLPKGNLERVLLRKAVHHHLFYCATHYYHLWDQMMQFLIYGKDRICLVRQSPHPQPMD